MTRSCTFQTAVYVYASNIEYREEKKEKKGTRKNEAERETVQSLSYGWLPCESEKNNNKKKATLNEKWTTIIKNRTSNIYTYV